MDTWLYDLRYACRTLVRHKGFAVTAIVMLAIAIGSTTAIFSVVNAVVVQPLPFPEADRVVSVMNFWTSTGTRGATVSAPDFRDWVEQSHSFDAMAYYSGGETGVIAGEAADYATVTRITPGFFRALGARAGLGRLLSVDEEQVGGALGAVITDAYWRRQFAARADVLGTTLTFGERQYTIVGVLAPQFRFPARTDIYAAQQVIPPTTSRSAHNYRVVARLKDGVSFAQASGDMAAIGQRLEQQYPNSNAGKAVIVVPLQETIVGSSRGTLFVLMGAVAFVLLIGCANVANLLLARATARRREMVVRAAVGGQRARLIRQLLTESLVLAAIAGAVGVLFARWGVSAFVALAPSDLPRLDEVGVDRTAMLFAVGISAMASLVFGLVPALQLSRVHIADGLRQGGKGSAVGHRAGWARHAFVVTQVALAVVLVMGAALLAKSLAALAAVDLGFDATRLVMLRTAVPVAGMDDAPQATAFYREIVPELRALPGVVSAAAVTGLPTAVRSNGGYWIQGGPGPEITGVRSPQAIFTVVTPDYFRAMRIPIVRGRDFSDRDRRDAPFVAIINEALARESFPGRDPIGMSIRSGLDTLEPMTIVGIVRDVRTWGPARPAQSEIYMAYQQHPGPAVALNIVMRTDTADPLAIANTAARLLRARNASVPVKIETMDATLATATATPRFRTLVLIVFATVALVLAIAGVYGVMAFTVSRRVPEIGVRVALGASPRSVLSLVMREGAMLTGAGVLLGVLLALTASRLASGLLFGVTPNDPLVVASVIAVVGSAALAACYVPGRRALQVDPVTALRAE
jgi:putative ABC transport system permease protein